MWNTTSTPVSSWSRVRASVMSPRTGSAPSRVSCVAAASDRASATTSSPRASSRLTTAEPRNPAPPVTKLFMGDSLPLGAPSRPVRILRYATKPPRCRTVVVASRSQVRYCGRHASRTRHTPRAGLPPHAAAQPHLGGAARRRPPHDGRGSGGRGAPHPARRQRLHGLPHARAARQPRPRRRDAAGGQRLLLRGLAGAHAPPLRLHAVRGRRALQRRAAGAGARRAHPSGVRRRPDPGDGVRALPRVSGAGDAGVRRRPGDRA